MMEGTESILLQKNTSPRVESIQRRPVFLLESEFQNQTNSKLNGLFGIISVSLSQNDMMQQTYFRMNMQFCQRKN